MLRNKRSFVRENQEHKAAVAVRPPAADSTAAPTAVARPWSGRHHSAVHKCDESQMKEVNGPVAQRPMSAVLPSSSGSNINRGRKKNVCAQNNASSEAAPERRMSIKLTLETRIPNERQSVKASLMERCLDLEDFLPVWSQLQWVRMHQLSWRTLPTEFRLLR